MKEFWAIARILTAAVWLFTCGTVGYWIADVSYKKMLDAVIGRGGCLLVQQLRSVKQLLCCKVAAWPRDAVPTSP